MRLTYCRTILLSWLAFGCGEASTHSQGAGGSTASGGAHSAGGSTNAGGTTTAAAGTGGAGTGGASPSGGSGVGGSSSTMGGATAAGGSSAGGQSAGGKSGSGGASASGGHVSTGGADASGGKLATGGAASTGGKSSSGGAGGAGGQPSGGASGSGSTQSSGCGKAPTIPSSQYNNGQPISITAANMERRYILNVPTNYDNTKPYRLVVAYHARDMNDKQLYSWQYYGLLPLSNNTTIFVAPNGQLNNKPCAGTGNGEASCGWPNPNDSDLALADAVVAQIEENFCVDKTRIFATGWSYGGSMSYRTACSRPLGGTANWGVRGIAIFSAAQLSGSCTPSKPVAFYASHGTHDSVLNYDQMGSLPLAQNFAKVNGCTWATPTRVDNGAHVCTNMAGCAAGYPLEYCSFNGDHTPYPDNGQSSGSWGPQEAWKFLNQF